MKVETVALTGLEMAAGDAPPSPVGVGAHLAGGSSLGSAAPGALICRVSKSKLATRLQKACRSYRRSRLSGSAMVAETWWKLIDDLFLKRKEEEIADSAVGSETLWWKAIDYARLNHSTVSFFDGKPERAISRLKRISLNASKVGRGLSKDGKGLKLAFQHWIEAIDRRHRYGHNLRFYCEEWCKSMSAQPFFYWLDMGDGRDVDLKKCPRSLLTKQCIRYLSPQEREQFEYVLIDGKIIHKQTSELLDTTKEPEGGKWIFVMSTSKRLYAGQKKKGMFHHSSFLAGGATLVAGMLKANSGVLKSISAESGHYRPRKEDLNKFLTYLTENGFDLNGVQVLASSKDDTKQAEEERPNGFMTAFQPPMGSNMEPTAAAQVYGSGAKTDEGGGRYKRTLSGRLKSPRVDVAQKARLEIRKATLCITFIISIRSKGGSSSRFAPARPFL